MFLIRLKLFRESFPICNEVKHMLFIETLGVCYDNGGRPVGADLTGPVLMCNEDDGTYKARQSQRRQRWCVNPNTGEEIPDTRIEKPERSPDCDDIGTVYTLHYWISICYIIVCSIQ